MEPGNPSYQLLLLPSAPSRKWGAQWASQSPGRTHRRKAPQNLGSATSRLAVPIPDALPARCGDKEPQLSF